MIKKLAYHFHSREAIRVYLIVCLIVFINSAFIGFVGIIPTAMYLVALFIISQRNPIMVYAIMVTAMLIDDMFIYDVSFLSFKNNICVVNCMELFNMGFVALLLNFGMKRKLGELFGDMGSQGRIFLLLLAQILFTCFINSFDYDSGLLQPRRFAQFYVFYLMGVYFMKKDEGLRYLVSLLGIFTLMSMVLGAIVILLGPSGPTYAGSQLIFAIPVLGGLVYRHMLIKGVSLSRFLREMLVIWGSASLLMLSESRRNAIFVGLFFVYALLKLQVYRRIFLALAMLGPIYLISQNAISDNFSDRLEMTGEGVGEIITEQGVSSKNKQDFFTGRDVIFVVAWDIFLENTAIGIGINNSYAEIKSRMGEALRPHNFFLQFLIETGVIGFSMYVIFIVMFLYGLRRARRIGLNLKDMALAGLAEGVMVFTIVSHVVALFGMFLLYDKFFWFSFAFGTAIYQLSLSKEKEARLEISEQKI